MAKPRFLFASANPSADLVDLHKSLRMEYEAIEELLHITNQQAFKYLNFSAEPGSSRKKILRYIDNPALRRDIYYFHFAGHGEDGDLYFQNEEGESERALLAGLGPFLNHFQNLKLVFLNCCTAESLAREIAGPNRIVIASPEKVPTYQAVHFATHFYQLLLHDNPIHEAFKLAITKVRTTPNEELRALIDIEDEEDEQLPHIGEVFKIYPEKGAEGKRFRLKDFFRHYHLDLEGRTLTADNPGSANKLYEPVQEINYHQQMGEYSDVRFGPSPHVMAFLIQGAPQSGAALLHHRFLRNIVKHETLRVRLNLNSRTGAVDVPKMWKLLGEAVGLKGKLPEADIAKAVLNALTDMRKDIVISLFNSQHHGAEELKNILQDLWFKLLEEFGFKILKIKRKLWFFLYVEDENHAEKCAPLEGLGGDYAQYLTSISPLGNFKDNELLEMLDNHKQILDEEYQDNTMELSKMIMRQSKGVPLEVLESLCEIVGEELESLTKQLKAI